MARGCRQVATPLPEEASGRPHHGQRRLEDVKWAATPMSEEIGGWPCHDQRRSVGGHAMAKRGQRAVSPWSKEVCRAPRHGRRKLAGDQAMVVVDWMAATPWLKEVARQVATPWPKEVIGRRTVEGREAGLGSDWADWRAFSEELEALKSFKSQRLRRLQKERKYVYIDVPDTIDISDMRSRGLQPGEELLPEGDFGLKWAEVGWIEGIFFLVVL
nr:ubiquitin carboxyl-terminal hydrolase 14 [Ipomoea batatas]